jgi:predicted transcriptional regulator
MKSVSHTEIAKLRASRDVRAKELADELDVHPVHLSYVENGRRQSASLVKRAVAFLLALPAKR